VPAARLRALPRRLRPRGPFRPRRRVAGVGFAPPGHAPAGAGARGRPVRGRLRRRGGHGHPHLSPRRPLGRGGRCRGGDARAVSGAGDRRYVLPALRLRARRRGKRAGGAGRPRGGAPRAVRCAGRAQAGAVAARQRGRAGRAGGRGCRRRVRLRIGPGAARAPVDARRRAGVAVPDDGGAPPPVEALRRLQHALHRARPSPAAFRPGRGWM
ncbi:MAG: N-acetylmannosaminyltransferase, partial [uncultured Gemmatimonadetes bacterium]